MTQRRQKPQQVQEDKPSVNSIAKANAIKFEPKNPRQRFHMRSMEKNQLTVVLGPAGTGKTYVSTIHAAKGILHGKYKKLVLMRPAVALEGEEHGFLPGNLWGKIAPWARPMLKKLSNFIGGEDRIIEMHRAGKIELSPFTYLRGDEFEADTFVMLDEAQNCTVGQMKAFTTRIADGSTIVISGDIRQSDIRGETGLGALGDIIKNYDIPAGIIEYSESDIERGELCAAFVKAWEQRSL